MTALTARLVLIRTNDPGATHMAFGKRLEGTDREFSRMQAYCDFTARNAITGLLGREGFTGLIYTPVWPASQEEVMDGFLHGPVARHATPDQLNTPLTIVPSRLLVARSTPDPVLRAAASFGMLLYWGPGSATDEQVRQVTQRLGEVNAGRNGLHDGHALELLFRLGGGDEGALLVLQLWTDMRLFEASVPVMQKLLRAHQALMPQLVTPLGVPSVGGYLLPPADQPLAYVA